MASGMPLELAHQRRHLGQGLGARRRARRQRAHAIEEELHRLGCGCALVGFGQAQRPELVADLAGEPAALARGHQEAHLRRLAHPGVERGRGRLDDLLQVVEDEERGPLPGEGAADARGGGGVLLPRDDRDAEGPGDGAAERAQIARGLELAEAHLLVRPRAGPADGELAGEPRLAHAGGAPHRHQAAALAEDARDRGQVGRASNEA